VKPEVARTNREELFFCYGMDCQTPKKPGGGPDQTWEVAEQAVRGLAALFAERGLMRALGFSSEPEVAIRQSAMFCETAEAGAWQALHFQVRGYRPQGASEDYDWERPLSFYDYEEQKAAIEIAKREWEEALGRSAVTYGACCAMANDYTFPILAELGFRQSYCSIPGRHNPRHGQKWWGACPYSHHTSSRSRLVCGDLPVYEIPITRSLQPAPGAEPGTWHVTDFRAESLMGREAIIAMADSNLQDMLLRDHPLLYVYAITHNTWDVGDRSSPRRRTVEATLEAMQALAERHRLELVPASLEDLHQEADRLGAY
jgi:hypothetical protein